MKHSSGRKLRRKLTHPGAVRRIQRERARRLAAQELDPHTQAVKAGVSLALARLLISRGKR